MKKKNNFLYFLEGLACICVILIHCHFPGYFGKSVIVFSRFAVPLFFVISGYFNYNSTTQDYKKRIIKLIKIFVFSSLLFISLKLLKSIFISHAFVQLTLGEILAFILFNYCDQISMHLWFILAMIYTYIFQIAVPKKVKKIFIIMPFLSIVLFIYLQFLKPTFSFPNVVFVRNWITIGVPFFIIGSLVKKYENKINVSNIWLLMFIIFSIILTVIECIVFRKVLKIGLPDLYIGTIIGVISTFIFAIKNPNFITLKFIENIGFKYSLIIYIVHPLYISMFNIIVKLSIFEINKWILPLCVFIFSYITAIMYEKVQKKIKILKRR